ncbi:single-stranded DNA-binding protein [Acetobacter ascendens]|uniref:Single-stranded DNA-binding protein n=1 Tax=Acetobacter ascendens TaxID=481146 RepID=A0A1Y0V0W3_9PROT|nr:single-stranded DNA-binding protein [Acetobacter ascendens]ARW11800.1 Single-stranded DNA-binding protein [Acetobacter ascendens]KDE19246.1 hypothetical protein AZ09_13155 [Acetobacter aceti 1023]
MSGSVNRVILVGNLGKDPVCEKRDDDMGYRVSFPLATSESWSDQTEGKRKQRREWHQVVCLDERLGETLMRRCRKGMQILIEGRLRGHLVVDGKMTPWTFTEIVLDSRGCDFTILRARKQTAQRRPAVANRRHKFRTGKK